MSRQVVRHSRVAESQITDHVRALVQGMDLSVSAGRVRAVAGARRANPKSRGAATADKPVRADASTARPDQS